MNLSIDRKCDHMLFDSVVKQSLHLFHSLLNKMCYQLDFHMVCASAHSVTMYGSHLKQKNNRNVVFLLSNSWIYVHHDLGICDVFFFSTSKTHDRSINEYASPMMILFSILQKLYLYQQRCDSAKIKCIESDNLVFGHTFESSFGFHCNQLEYKIYSTLQLTIE